MILTITQAGLAREADALTTGNMPKFDKLVIGSGAPHATPFLATAMVQSAFETQVIVVERLSAGAVKFHAAIPSDIEVNIREIGLFLEDGTLYAYADYSQGTGQSFFKSTGFAFSFFVLLTREQLPNLVFTYVPVDTASIALTISQNASAAIDLQIQDFLSNQYTAADVLTKIKTVDGADSGLDADLLDGQQGSYYVMPAGAISMFARSTAPEGWLKANGAEISRTAYSSLFNAIGTTFGAGDGSGTFNLPDLRGEFLRSWDDGKGVDNQRVFGSWQIGTAIAGVDDDANDSVFFFGAGTDISADPIESPALLSTYFAQVVEHAGAAFYKRTRPRNVALLACIKY